MTCELATRECFVVMHNLPETQHWIFLNRLVHFTAQKLAVLVGFVVGHADNHFIGPKGGSDSCHALGEFVDEEVLRRSVTPRPSENFLTVNPRNSLKLEDGFRVNANHIVDNKFDPSETHPGVW